MALRACRIWKADCSMLATLSSFVQFGCSGCNALSLVCLRLIFRMVPIRLEATRRRNVAWIVRAAACSAAVASASGCCCCCCSTVRSSASTISSTRSAVRSSFSIFFMRER